MSLSKTLVATRMRRETAAFASSAQRAAGRSSEARAVLIISSMIQLPRSASPLD